MALMKETLLWMFNTFNAIVNETLISDNCSLIRWLVSCLMNGKKIYFFTLHEVLRTPKEPQLQNKRTNPRLLISEDNDRFTADGEIK